MIKLYYAPMSCSLAVSILLRELGLAYEALRVDLATKQLPDGAPFEVVNPKVKVPALEIEGGEILTEVGPILQHLADRDPRGEFIAPQATVERRRQAEWLSFLSGELHKAVFYVIFHPDAPDPAKDHARSIATEPLDLLAATLSEQPYLTEQYSLADMLLVVFLCWSEYGGIDLSRWPVLFDYRARLLTRNAVRAALTVERAEFAAS